VLDSHTALIEWYRSTAMRPSLSQLASDAERAEFEQEVLEACRSQLSAQKARGITSSDRTHLSRRLDPRLGRTYPPSSMTSVQDGSAMSDSVTKNLRIDRRTLEVTTHSQAEQNDRQYWFSRTPIERLQHVEALRELNYGPDVLNQRLQKVLAVLERSRR
jgi:type II secretory pathway pseudopilin PulG